jgi:pentalenene oxygenase
VPAPRGHRLLGHLPAIRSDPLGLLDRCEPPHAALWLGRAAYVLLEPADVAHVLTAGSDRYTKGKAFRYGRRLYGNSLLVSEGADHREQARAIGGLFFRHAAPAFLDAAAGTADRLADRWKSGDAIDLWAAANDLTLALSSQAVFGSDHLPRWLPGGTAGAEAILGAFDTAMTHVARQNFSLVPLPDWLPAPAVLRYRRAVATLDGAVASSVARRAKAPAGGLLDQLLAYRDGDGKPLPPEQVRDQALILLLGGYESSAATLCWALLLLGRHEAVRRRLLDELRRVAGNRLPAPGDADRLTYAGCVLSEALRLYPPPWLMPRTAVTPDELPSGLRLPAGAQVFLSPYRTQRDPRFFPEPARFDPDRFAGPPAWPAGAYLPFGMGSRHCIGESVARSQLVLVLAALSRRWRFECDPPGLPAPRPLLSLRPPVPLRVSVRPAE